MVEPSQLVITNSSFTIPWSRREVKRISSGYKVSLLGKIGDTYSKIGRRKQKIKKSKVKYSQNTDVQNIELQFN